MLYGIDSCLRPLRGQLLFILLAAAPCVGAAWLTSADGQVKGPATTVDICGSAIDVRFEGETNAATRADLLNWVRRAGEAVCTYYGKFPVSRLKLDVRIRGGAGVHGGVTFPDNDGYINISLGEGTTVTQLNDDWMLTHEMIHLAFPSMARKHHWIEEGISVYVEPVARVQAGQLSAERMWHDVVRDIPQGEPEAGDQGLDNTHTWGRTYWGGAMFCLIADVRIREQTRDKKGLQDALRGVLAAGGNITQDWEIERALAASPFNDSPVILWTSTLDSDRSNLAVVPSRSDSIHGGFHESLRRELRDCACRHRCIERRPSRRRGPQAP